MPVTNSDVSHMLLEVADLLEIRDENRFRVRAYRTAARTVSGLSGSVADMEDAGKMLIDLPGIGRDMADKIREIIDTGRLEQLEKLHKKTPGELSDMMQIAGLGGKRVRKLHEELGIGSIRDLEQAASSGRVSDVPGFGAKTEQNILEEIGELGERTRRVKLFTAEQTAGLLADYLRGASGVKKVTVAGSYRRRRATVGDLDILVTCKKGSDIMKRFVDYEDVRKVISRGSTRSTVKLRTGLQVDLRVVAQVSYGAALHYFTGSKSHSIAVRRRGSGKGLKINEYGVFKGDDRIAGRTEKEVYKTVGLAYIEPELREDRGEIEAARTKKLPRLITADDLRGDLHSHTRATDGHASLEEMAQAARKKGYDYLAVTEHSRRVRVANGLDRRRLAAQIKQIDKLNGKFKTFVILKGIEVDILEDGSLDLPDDILKELDLTVCSVHSKFNLSRKKQTERIIRAMDNPFFSVLGHPTGRLLNERGPCDLDMGRILRAARERGCIMEVNAHPDRLDLDDAACKAARELGVRLAVSTDAHSATDLDFMRFGIDQARRGWLEPDDVVNTRTCGQLKKLLRRK